MNLEKVVSVFRSCGYKIHKIRGCYFLDRGLINYSFPQLIDVQFNFDFANSLKWRYPISIIKTKSKIKNTNEFVLETHNYGIEKFASKKRNDIRKSLKDCIFKRPPLEDLFEFGIKMNQRTLAKQGRKDKFLTEPCHWRKYISSFYFEENILILGAYIGNQMVGYITVCKIAGNYYIIDPFYDFNAAASSPTQGLIFTLVNQVIEKDGAIKIYYGLESFNPLPSLNKYKESMLFKRIPATRAYVINPFIKAFLIFIIFVYVKLLKRKSIKNLMVQKVIRLYQGSRILTKLSS